MSRYKKIYVFDTSVLLHDPNAIEKFHDNVVVIPNVVIQELDKHKNNNRLGETAMNARSVSRRLRKYKQDQGSLLSGVATETGGLLFTDNNGSDFSRLPSGMERTNDHRIILTALAMKDRYPDHQVTIVTKDANLDLTADACGVAAEDYESDRALANIDSLYTGNLRVTVPESESHLLTDLYREKSLVVDRLKLNGQSRGMLANTCVELQVENGSSALMVYKKAKRLMRLVDRKSQQASTGLIAPRNNEQHLFADLVMDEDLSLVTCTGKAGCGKTLIALKACNDLLDSRRGDKKYERLLIYRPLAEVGKGVGYLPGDLEEKFAHYTLPIYDNFSLISGDITGSDDSRTQKGKHKTLQSLIQFGVVEIAPLTFIRGRSLNRCLVLVDDAQNMTPHEAKTLITRIGFNSKIILVGDPYQIDNPFLDPLSNGLSFVVERFKGQEMYGHITMVKSERSALAELAADIL